jgi:hypothetical protein
VPPPWTNGPRGSVTHQLTKYRFPCKPRPTPHVSDQKCCTVPATIITQTLYTNSNAAWLHTSQKYFAWLRSVIIAIHLFHTSKECPLNSGFLHPKLGYSTCPCLHHHLSLHGLVTLFIRLHPSFHLADSLPSRSLWFSVAMQSISWNSLYISTPSSTFFLNYLSYILPYINSCLRCHFEAFLDVLVHILQLSIQQAVYWPVVHFVAKFLPPPFFFDVPKWTPEIFNFT